jgi:hypothetical protein
MADATRRNVMKNIVSMPLAAAAGSSFIGSAEAQPTTTSVRFNVVVHGGAVIEFDTQTVRVKVQLPDLKDHCYLAGYWGVESPLDAGENYSFGTTILGGNQLPPSLKKGQTKDFPIIRQQHLTAGKPPRNSFDLPFPTDIVSAYSAKCLGQKAFFKDGSLLEFQPKKLPLVSVLQYSFIATTVPALVASSSFSWVPQINFHIFAELPTDQMPSGHAADLLNAEQDLYSQLIGHPILFSDDVLQGNCENSASVDLPPGISIWETASLAKRALATCPPLIPSAGGHPASCMALVVIQ